jgi:hypothetical protein
MRQSVHDTTVTFRASDTIVSALSDQARAAGVSVSEYLRGMVRERVHSDAGAPPQITCDQPLPVHTRAAFGDGAAFSALANSHYQRALNGDEMAIISLARAVDYARLAAIRVNGRQEWIALIFLLEQHAEALRREHLNALADIAQAEAVALAEHMGDFGDEEIGQLVVAAGANLSPEVLKMASDLHGIGLGVTA